MRALKYFLLAMLVAPMILYTVSAQEVTCPKAVKPATIDGRWGDGEWDDAVQLALETWSGYKSGEGFIRIKYDEQYFYAIIDFTSVSTASEGDGAAIQFDTNHDGGNRVKRDDYRFNVYYGGQGSMAQGGGSGTAGFDWGLPLPEGALVNASIGPSPNSPRGHPIYEFRIPLSLFPETSAVGFAAGVWHGTGSQRVLLTWPKDYYIGIPNTWGSVNFPTPIPEFPSAMAPMVSALLILILAIRGNSKRYPP